MNANNGPIRLSRQEALAQIAKHFRPNGTSWANRTEADSPDLSVILAEEDELDVSDIVSDMGYRDSLGIFASNVILPQFRKQATDETNQEYQKAQTKWAEGVPEQTTKIQWKRTNGVFEIPRQLSTIPDIRQIVLERSNEQIRKNRRNSDTPDKWVNAYIPASLDKLEKGNIEVHPDNLVKYYRNVRHSISGLNRTNGENALIRKNRLDAPKSETPDEGDVFVYFDKSVRTGHSAAQRAFWTFVTETKKEAEATISALTKDANHRRNRKFAISQQNRTLRAFGRKWSDEHGRRNEIFPLNVSDRYIRTIVPELRIETIRKIRKLRNPRWIAKNSLFAKFLTERNNEIVRTFRENETKAINTAKRQLRVNQTISLSDSKRLEVLNETIDSFWKEYVFETNRTKPTNRTNSTKRPNRTIRRFRRYKLSQWNTASEHNATMRQSEKDRENRTTQASRAKAAKAKDRKIQQERTNAKELKNETIQKFRQLTLDRTNAQKAQKAREGLERLERILQNIPK